ncbi:DUF1178 family protein [Palleronia sp.]|uniref:DUF1178 family protein n=1 Tax=Palleronia sp. TaxID=1940284 RepID=UPI0035C7A796
MIRYALKCREAHSFDSWFRSAEAFDSLRAAGQLSCPECGASEVQKAPMAPGVATRDDSKTEHPLARLRREIEAKADYVGDRFAREARAIHDGKAPERPIWGEARLSEARALIEDGIPAAPLPFLPKSKAN